MKSAELLLELRAIYERHGWELKSLLLEPTTLAVLKTHHPELIENVVVKEAAFDALWFSRPSHNGREAWELRLLSQTQYALFETFEPDESAEERDEFRVEMEARMREYLGRE